MLNRPLAFYRETCVFTPVGLERTNRNFRTTFSILNNVAWRDLRTHQIWLRSVHRGRRHTVVKCLNVTVLWLLFSLFSASSSRLQVAILHRICNIPTKFGENRSNTEGIAKVFRNSRWRHDFWWICISWPYRAFHIRFATFPPTLVRNGLIVKKMAPTFQISRWWPPQHWILLNLGF